MANKNFVVKNGLTVGNLTVDADSGNVTTSGNIVTSGVYTDSYFYANGSPFVSSSGTGFTGSIGFTGSQGSQGQLGYTGSKGEDGIIGVDGYTGSKGADGTIGVDGYTGSIGYTGSTGYAGSSGYTGSRGDVGYTGSAGSVSDGGGVTTYNLISQLPLSGNSSGDLAFVEQNNRLYLWNGTGWFNIALINTNPTITNGPNPSYAFATNGTPVVITLVATDPKGIPITWSSQVTTGTLGNTAVITQNVNVFTITPSTSNADAGTFGVTFTASDGVNIATASSSFTLAFAPDWSLTTQQAKIQASDPEASDRFGYAVAISGDTVVVGAYLEDTGGTDAGAAYVFVRSGTTWTQQAKIQASDLQASDLFGHAVAISGDTVVVGAYGEDTGGTEAGAAYVFIAG